MRFQSSREEKNEAQKKKIPAKLSCILKPLRTKIFVWILSSHVVRSECRTTAAARHRVVYTERTREVGKYLSSPPLQLAQSEDMR